MSKYHPNALRAMALRVIEAWHENDSRYQAFMARLQSHTGMPRPACERFLTQLAGY